MKILMLCDLFQDDLEYQENLLLKYYIKNGHDVTILASLFESAFDYYADRVPKGNARSYKLDGAQIIKMPYRRNILNRVRAFPSIENILKEVSPDLIYVHNIVFNLIECAEYVRRHSHARLIMDFHGDFSNSGKNWISINILHRVIRKRYLDVARPHISRIFPVTPGCREFLHKVYDVPLSEMELLPLGTDLEFGAAIKDSGGGAKVRAALEIGRSDLVIFSGGKLLPVRRTELLIDAFRAMGRSDLHLIIVGKADSGHEDYQDMLRTRAQGAAGIHFVGWLDKQGMYEHLDAADLAVFPGGQSVIWQQAIGMGLPLIVADRTEHLRGHQDASYLNCHDNMMFLNPARDASTEIEHMLRGLIDDRSRLACMAKGARRTAAEILDWNSLIARTLRFNDTPRRIESGTPNRSTGFFA